MNLHIRELRLSYSQSYVVRGLPAARSRERCGGREGRSFRALQQVVVGTVEIVCDEHHAINAEIAQVLLELRERRNSET